MPYWKFAGNKNNSPSIPLYVYGEEFDFSMTFVNDTTADFTGCYLFVHREFIELLQAKVADEAVYRVVMGNQDPNCYVGTLPVGETQIDFRLKNDSELLTGLRNLYIPVYVAHDDGSPVPCYLWFGDSEPLLWKDCYEHAAFWREDYAGVDETAVCLGVDTRDGFLDSLEPGLFEDSAEPGLWE